MSGKFIIFDLDGTLVNTIEDLGTAVNHVLAATGRPVHDIDEYRMMVGDGVRKLVQRALPAAEQEDEELPDRLLPAFREYYGAHIAVHSRPYPGIPELLSELACAGYGMAVASNKYLEGTVAIIRHFFPDIPFAAVAGGTGSRPLKPDPSVLFEIMERSGAVPGNTVMVGDSGTDVQTARNAGIRSVGVTWGFRPDAARQADAVAEDIAGLRRILLGL